MTWQRKNLDRKLNKGCSLVMDALKACQKLSSAQDLHSWLKENADDAPGLTTVYRAIETLLRLDLIQSVDLGDGEKRFELVEPGGHHHHLICTSCMASIHLDQCFVDSLIDKVDERHGFKARTHVLEIFGICSECEKQQKHARR